MHVFDYSLHLANMGSACRGEAHLHMKGSDRLEKEPPCGASPRFFQGVKEAHSQAGWAAWRSQGPQAPNGGSKRRCGTDPHGQAWGALVKQSFRRLVCGGNW